WLPPAAPAGSVARRAPVGARSRRERGRGLPARPGRTPGGHDHAAGVRRVAGGARRPARRGISGTRAAEALPDPEPDPARGRVVVVLRGGGLPPPDTSGLVRAA